MPNPQDYNINLDVQFDYLQKMDIPTIVEACTDDWFNQTLCQVNESVVRLGIVQGEFHWHKHDEEDEFFFVLSGKLYVDLEDETIELSPQQGVTVPKGIVHRTRAPERTVMLMIEKSSVQPTGD